MRATKSEQLRMAKVKSLPCVACDQIGMRHLQCGPTEAHHLLSGGRRRGHAFTVPLGIWHHRGLPLDGMTVAQMESWYGPSLRLQSKLFRETFGDDNKLLSETNELLGAT